MQPCIVPNVDQEGATPTTEYVDGGDHTARAVNAVDAPLPEILAQPIAYNPNLGGEWALGARIPLKGCEQPKPMSNVYFLFCPSPQW